MSAPRVAVVTGATAQDLADEVDAPLVAGLRERGAEVVRPRWRDEVDWSGMDLAVVRTCWDYVSDRDAFVAWAAATGEVTSLWNPPDVLRWNSHKGHLLELEEAGAPVVPTAWCGQGDTLDLAELADSRGWDVVVIKPAVGNGGRALVRVDTRDGADRERGQAHLVALLADGDVMIQPWLSRVATDGELSVVVIGGEVSHVVAKVPAAGSMLAHSHQGARYERVDPTTGAGAEPAALARWVVEATGQAEQLLFARVDLVPADDGTWQLGELELTEPDLYLGQDPAAAGRLADALLARRP